MRILIYGAKGWIGTQFLNWVFQQGHDQTHTIVYGQARVYNVTDLENEIQTVCPTHVVSLIGRTSGVYNGEDIKTIDYLEKPGKLVENVRDNLFSPITLANLASRYNYHFTYLGTGCIFNYTDNGNHVMGSNIGYTENDIPNFTGSSYSIVKGYTDQLMHQLPVLNLRIRMPISNQPNPRNFITKITQYAKICSIPNSMTVLTDFFPIWWDLICNNKIGSYNCTNPGAISHNEILEMYRQYVDPQFVWTNFSLEEQAQVLASGRSNNMLDTSKLECEYPNVPNIFEAVRRVLKQYRSV